LLQMSFCILWISSKRLSQNVSILNFVHRFMQFIRWRWNTFNFFLPIDLFSAHKSFYFDFCLFPIFHSRHSLYVECSRLSLGNVICFTC
jgi:hypothetical protein